MRAKILQILEERGLLSEVYRRGKTALGVTASRHIARLKSVAYKALSDEPSVQLKRAARRPSTSRKRFRNRFSSRMRRRFLRAFKPRKIKRDTGV